MACKTDGRSSRSKAPRSIGAHFEPFIRRISDSAVSAMRTGTTPVSLPRVEPSLKDIRKRAYLIYLARGGVNGDAAADWTQAEREIRDELNSGAQNGYRL